MTLLSFRCLCCCCCCCCCCDDNNDHAHLLVFVVDYSCFNFLPTVFCLLNPNKKTHNLYPFYRHEFVQHVGRRRSPVRLHALLSAAQKTAAHELRIHDAASPKATKDGAGRNAGNDDDHDDESKERQRPQGWQVRRRDSFFLVGVVVTWNHATWATAGVSVGQD